jgi:uncharacterized protein YcsI (UPF0317 family)
VFLAIWRIGSVQDEVESMSFYVVEDFFWHATICKMYETPTFTQTYSYQHMTLYKSVCVTHTHTHTTTGDVCHDQMLMSFVLDMVMELGRPSMVLWVGGT